MTDTVLKAIASRVVAVANCKANSNAYWYAQHMSAANDLARDSLPSGSGLDNGTRIDWDRSNADRLVFRTAYHHMDDNGFYDGWTEHSVTVRASLALGFTLSVSGRDRNGIKDYIAETFALALSETVPEGR